MTLLLFVEMLIRTVVWKEERKWLGKFAFLVFYGRNKRISVLQN